MLLSVRHILRLVCGELSFMVPHRVRGAEPVPPP